MKTAAKFFRDNYFGRQLPFDYRLYMIFFVECLFISLVSSIANTLLRAGMIGVLFQWPFNLLCFVLLFVPLRIRMRMSKPLLLFTSFVYVPFLFFQTAGYDGTAGMFALLTVFMLAVIFKGKKAVFLVALNILFWVVACTLQYFYPELVVAHENGTAEYVDYLVALVLATVGIGILAGYLRGAFELESRRIHSLLKKLEENNKRLSELSSRDPLTGIYNRRFLMEYFQTEMALFMGSGVPYCVMMLDLDHFKNINDTYGHGFGDEVLVQFAQEVQSILRKQDVFARIGGEEFVVLLYDVDMEAAREIAERARVTVSELRFRGHIQVTVSIGLVKAQKGEDGDLLVDRADTCLYQAKEQGRNRVVTG